MTFTSKAILTLAALLMSIVTSAESRKVNKPERRRPDVLLITVDTLRADRVGSYGAKNIATPAMDSLAHDGFLFERAIAQVPLTVPSHDAIMTGTYPFQNGVQDFTSAPLSPTFQT